MQWETRSWSTQKGGGVASKVVLVFSQPTERRDTVTLFLRPEQVVQMEVFTPSWP